MRAKRPRDLTTGGNDVALSAPIDCCQAEDVCIEGGDVACQPARRLDHNVAGHKHRVDGQVGVAGMPSFAFDEDMVIVLGGVHGTLLDRNLPHRNFSHYMERKGSIDCDVWHGPFRVLLIEILSRCRNKVPHDPCRHHAAGTTSGLLRWLKDAQNFPMEESAELREDPNGPEQTSHMSIMAASMGDTRDGRPVGAVSLAIFQWQGVHVRPDEEPHGAAGDSGLEPWSSAPYKTCQSLSATNSSLNILNPIHLPQLLLNKLGCFDFGVTQLRMHVQVPTNGH
mmetsp:Transcript_47732/g.85235  ORF Transcript_47732/g.85235 Transcript_47732/m.85235 type:complete len:281 (-) Transcript_47732:74-916(-)